jgi:hypothetical protein
MSNGFPYPTPVVNPDGSTINGGGVSVPPHDCEVITYDGNGNPTTITYRVDDGANVGENGAIVAVVSITYDGSGNPTIIKRTA